MIFNINTFTSWLGQNKDTSMTVLTTKRMQVLLDFLNVFIVVIRGLSGGLALMWKADITIDIQAYSRSHHHIYLNNIYE